MRYVDRAGRFLQGRTGGNDQGEAETGGAGNRSRTYDLRITNALLYQLSYAGEKARAL